MMKRLMVTVAAAASLLTLAGVPQAGAAQSAGEGVQTPITVGGLKLIPAHLTKNNARAAAAAADEQAFLIPSALDPGKCWDAEAASLGRNGTNMLLWDCDTTKANQAFFITQIPEGFLRFQNVANGRYLDADSNTIGQNGTKVQLWDYVAGAKNQWWTSTIIPEGWERFSSAASGRYVTAQGGSSANGTRLQLWSFIAGGQSQWWG